MTRVYAALILMLIAAPGLRAETVRVNSGEHVDFSRLVLPFEIPVAWEMGRVQGGYAIRFDHADLIIDIDRVFNKIPRTRISGLRVNPDGRTLEIVLGCDCHADVFDYPGNKVVIDVKDGPANSWSQFEAALEPAQVLVQPAAAETETVQVPASINPHPAVRVRHPSVVLPLDINRPDSSPTVGDAPENQGPARAHLPSPLAEQAVTPEHDILLHSLQQDVLAQLSRAAAQGLVSVPAFPEPPPAQNDTEPVPETVMPPPDATPLGAMANITVETSIDRDQRGNHSDSQGKAESCPSPSLFEIPAWGQDDEITASISAGRAGLITEIGEIDRAALNDLVRANLYATFGAEAAAIITRHGIGSQQDRVHMALAQILDQGFAKPSDALSLYSDCSGLAPLWALLAQPEISAMRSSDPAAVLAGFLRLPAHLRRHLGPMISQRYLDAGDEATARSIQSATSRVSEAEAPAIALVDARIDLGGSYRRSAQARLSDLLASNTPSAISAAVLLIESRISADQHIDPVDIEVVQTLAYEHRDSKTGGVLEYALIQAQVQNLNFDFALDRIRQMPPLQPSEQQALAEQFISRLWGKADDLTFLRVLAVQTASPVGESLLGQISPDLHRDVVRRALLLGMADLADRVFQLGPPLDPDRPPDDADGQSLHLLRARIALAKGEADQAVAYLEGASGAEVDRLRLRAHMINRSHLDAAHIAEMTTQPDVARAEYWRAGAWQDLEDSDNHDVRFAAQRMRAEQGGDPDDVSTERFREDGAISAAQLLLEDSAEARGHVDALVNTFGVSE